MGFDYTITSKTVLGVLATGYIRDWELNALNDIFYKRDGQITNRKNINTFEINKWTHYMGNVNLRHYFKEDEILEFNFDYLRYDNNNPSNYKISNTEGTGNTDSGEAIEVTKSTPLHILVGMMDYSSQLGPKLKFEGGVKATITRFSNDVGVSYLRNGNWQFDNELTNNYRMKEDISAIYSTLSFSLNAKTSLVTGLRYEYMNTVLGRWISGSRRNSKTRTVS